MSDPGAAEPDGANPGLAYLDSNVYLDYLIGGRDWHDAVRDIFEAWQRGDLAVATSALTIVEVLDMRDADGNRRTLAPAEEPRIADLFNPAPPRKLRLVNVTRAVAERSRELVWDHKIRPKDAIHVASALLARVPVMFTSDRRLQGREAGGDPPLRIEPPYWSG